MTNKRRMITATILLLTAFTALLNQTLMITALPIMSHTLNISLNLAQWLTAGYVLMIGLTTPLSANLSEKYTSRQLFLGIVAVFIVGTIIGPLTTNFYIILLGRLIQAMAGGVLTTFVMVSMLAIFPPEKRGTVMGFVSLVISSGPAIGPSLSGLIMNYFSWQYLFYLILPIMILALIAGWLWLPNYSEAKPVKIDLLSVVTSMLGVGLILSSITIFGQQFWLALAMLVVGVITTWIFVSRQLHLSTPLLSVKLFKKPSFTLMVVSTMLVFAILMGTEALIPIYVENIVHKSSLLAGLVMLPGAFANGLTAPLIGRYYDEHGPKVPLIAGLILLIISSVPFLTMNLHTSMWWLMIVYIVRMIGISMIMSTATTESLKDLTPDQLSHGTAWNNALRQVSGSAANTILIMISLIPSQLLAGYDLAMGVTFGAVFLLLLVCVSYLIKNNHSEA